MDAVALLVAAGSGERLGADRPKAFVVLAGIPMYEWSLDALAYAGIPADRVVMAIPPAAGPEGDLASVTCVPGGATRSESVRNALAAAPPSEFVVVHDAARPLAPPALFVACLAALTDADAAIAAARVTDTIKEAEGDRVSATLERSRLWAVQTPQAFRREALERALEVTDEILAQASDDAWLVERAGGTVRVVQGPASNFKITTPQDLRLAELLLTEGPLIP